MPFEMRTNILPPLRIAQGIIALLVLCLDAYPANWYTSTPFPTPPAIIFLLFTSVFTLLLQLPYSTLCPTYFPLLANGHVSLVVELATTLCWFAAFVAQAVYLAHLAVCRGSVCGSARAATVFGAAEFVLFVLTSYFPVYHCFLAGGDGEEERDTATGKGFKMLSFGKGSGGERVHKAWFRRGSKDETSV